MLLPIRGVEAADNAVAPAFKPRLPSKSVAGKGCIVEQGRIPAALRVWFAQQQRALPWRVANAQGMRDPYRTWIAEIMLQQTRVEAVIPYFENFLRVFPDAQTFALAAEVDVLRAWSGLGYYRRARMLHAAAALLMEKYQGTFPPTAAALRALPGIGAYTAAAIASLAFGERIAVVDGNVKRVVARLFAWELAADDKQLELAARQQGAVWMATLPLDELAAAGQLNEAMMELGATVCLPRNPLCDVCPLRENCLARQAGRAAQLPLPKKAKKWVDLEMVFLVHRVGERVLLAQREGGWSPGLFEPPSILLAQQSPAQAALDLQGLATQSAAALQDHGVVRHTITHHRIRAFVYSLVAPTERPTTSGAQWLDPASVPLTGLASKVLRCTFA